MRGKTKGKRVRDSGAVALRVDLMNIGYHLQAAEEALKLATIDAGVLGVVDQLAVATKALRTIYNTKSTDQRAKGVAGAAILKMMVRP